MNDNELNAFLQHGLTGGVFPCYAAATGEWASFGGYRAVYPQKEALTEDTLFDMASLSKLIGTTCAALKLIEHGKLHLQDTVGMFFEHCYGKEKITVHQLMTHSSGIKPHFPLWLRGIEPKDAADEILREELGYPTGTEVAYTCMGYILLGKMIEKIEKQPLDQIVCRLVFEPLGMQNSFYNPPSDRPCAATEGELCGVVHDENARFLGGVSGNAGVFCTLGDAVRFARMIQAHGEGYLPRELFDMAIRNYTAGFREDRGLGFQLCSFGYGHTGFTGTSIYANDKTYAVLLTNRVHPTRENAALAPFRREFHKKIFGV